jgi:hypothetical protein
MDSLKKNIELEASYEWGESESFDRSGFATVSPFCVHFLAKYLCKAMIDTTIYLRFVIYIIVCMLGEQK